MREDINHLVYPVLRQGLGLRPRLLRGERLDLPVEQAKLRSLLLTEHEARRWPAFGGDGEQFLGVRYALACWLDELFSFDSSPWRTKWNESKMETALYGSNDRAWRFWEQAKLAEARAERDALEGFYLCVMLGFRGEQIDKPRAVQDWRAGVERQLGQGKAAKWDWDVGLPAPPPDVPPLKARERLRFLFAATLVTVGVAILVGMFTVVSRLGG